MLRTYRTNASKVSKKRARTDTLTNFGDSTLHDDEVGIVDIELNSLKEKLDCLLGRLVPIEKIL